MVHVPSDPRWSTGRLKTFAQARHWRQALKHLEVLGQKAFKFNIIHCNSALAACAWPLAGHLLRHAERHAERAGADAFTVNSACAACERRGRWGEALQLLAWAARGALRCEVLGYNGASSAAAKDGRWTQSMEVLKEMRTNTLQRTVISFAALSVKWPWALETLELMRHCDASPGAYHVNGAITSCGASQLWRAALFRVGDAAADVVGCNAAMSACEWLWAAELLECMAAMGSIQQDIISFNALLNAYSAEDLWPRAVNLWRLLEGRDVEPSTVTANCLIGSAAWPEAWQCLHRFLQGGVEVDVIGVNSVISSDWRMALTCEHFFARAGLRRTLITYGALTSTTASGPSPSAWSLAQAVWAQQAQQGAAAEAVGQSAMLKAWADGQQWRWALEMPPSDLNGYGAQLNALSSVGRWRAARAALSSAALSATLSATRVLRSAVCCHSAVAGCERAGAWEQVLLLEMAMFNSSSRWRTSPDGCRSLQRSKAKHEAIRGRALNRIMLNAVVSAREKGGLLAGKELFDAAERERRQAAMRFFGAFTCLFWC
ncbi:unnamed protein product [Durusdinium trenchii]|uniref:Pentatricopeptide repeat-containing protein n=1 Tax=Durusdinium trenchii TaxID=1381693 RepID=A0ABP0ICJ9_9DINO